MRDSCRVQRLEVLALNLYDTWSPLQSPSRRNAAFSVFSRIGFLEVSCNANTEARGRWPFQVREEDQVHWPPRLRAAHAIPGRQASLRWDGR